MENHELYLLLGEMKGDIKAILKMQEATVTWQVEHEKNDDRRFGALNKYALSIAAVASVIGAGATYIWKKFVGIS